MRIRVWRRVAVAATTPTPTRGSTPGLFCSNEGIQLQLSGRQLAVLFEIQNPARSVLALLAGAALSTQAIDLQFHVCSNFVLVFFLKQTQFQYLSMSHSLV